MINDKMMPSNEDPQIPVQLLETVVKRWEVFNALRNSPRTKPELESEVDVSRSTIDRAIDELSSHSLGSRDYQDGRFVLTKLGKHVLRLIKENGAAITSLADLQETHESLPPVTDAICVFVRGTVTSPGEHYPDRPWERFKELAVMPSSLQIFLPKVHEQVVTGLLENRSDEMLSTRLVTVSEAANIFRRRYGDVLDQFINTPSATFQVTAGGPDYGVCLGEYEDDSIACLLIYDGSGLPVLVENQSQVATGWANAFFTELLGQSEQDSMIAKSEADSDLLKE